MQASSQSALGQAMQRLTFSPEKQQLHWHKLTLMSYCLATQHGCIQIYRVVSCSGNERVSGAHKKQQFDTNTMATQSCPPEHLHVMRMPVLECKCCIMHGRALCAICMQHKVTCGMRLAIP